MRRSVGPRSRSKKDRIYTALRQAILTLAMEPGAVLVEAALGRRFSVGKSTIREALVLLQRDGLVAALPRRGYLVTEITLRDVQELIELRIVLDCAAAELAAKRITAEELRHLEMLISPPGTVPDSDTMRTLLDRNREFHIAIARASRNDRLVSLVERIVDEMTRLVVIGYDTGEHSQILAALKAGDAERARIAAANHILGTRERVLKRQFGGLPSAVEQGMALASQSMEPEAQRGGAVRPAVAGGPRRARSAVKGVPVR